MGIEGYLVSPAVFKTVEGGDPALVSSILTCPRQNERPGLLWIQRSGAFFMDERGPRGRSPRKILSSVFGPLLIHLHQFRDTGAFGGGPDVESVGPHDGSIVLLVGLP